MAEYTVVTKEVEYTPEWDGNKDKPSPIRATLRYITAGERAQCIGMRTVRGDVAIEIDYGKCLRFCLKKLHDFRVNGAKVETPEQLMELSGFDGLFMELALKAWNMNAKEDTSPLP